MKVAELLERLKVMPFEADVFIHYDGSPYGRADAVWLTQRGSVSIGQADEPVYNDEARSEGALPASTHPYLKVGEMLGIKGCDV